MLSIMHFFSLYTEQKYVYIKQSNGDDFKKTNYDSRHCIKEVLMQL